MIRSELLVLALCLSFSASAEVDEYNVPERVNTCVAGMKEPDFGLSDRLNPFYLRGDFDGDNKADYAVLIVQRETNKGGILVCFGGPREPVRIAAGTPFAVEGGHKTDNLSRFDAWNIEEPDRHFHKDRIYLVVKESASGLIYWDGRQFSWEQVDY